MELLDIGQLLKAERENQGISLQKAHEDTRISLNFLESLENGEVPASLHPVYAKGFVQNYARYLNLDWKKISDDFATICSAEDHFRKISEDDLPTSLKSSDSKSKLCDYLKVLVILLAVIVVSGFGWFVYNAFQSGYEHAQNDHFSDPAPQESHYQEIDPFIPPSYPQDQAPDFQAFEDETDDALQIETGIPEYEAQDQEALQEDSTRQSQDDTILEDETTLETAEPEVPPAQADADDREFQAPAAQQQEQLQEQPEINQLVIQAREDCWMMAMIDGSSREVYLRSGERISIEFEDRVRLTLGNAGGVDLVINGEPYPLDAASGEVRTIDISSP
ncbi:helix-turn-helix domain-containing protein [Desulfonatronovibrio magnus]|uniref:helix-turn-helix domain-containing protein n=1 Tax=Desulfonatronovibrio magnus TaxID=698827 RepID=UPI0005EBD6DA|nr:helix-turn-helix domain-containing protein [Desulfonatronovibrio magnus]